MVGHENYYCIASEIRLKNYNYDLKYFLKTCQFIICLSGGSVFAILGDMMWYRNNLVSSKCITQQDSIPLPWFPFSIPLSRVGPPDPPPEPWTTLPLTSLHPHRPWTTWPLTHTPQTPDHLTPDLCPSTLDYGQAYQPHSRPWTTLPDHHWTES